MKKFFSFFQTTDDFQELINLIEELINNEQKIVGNMQQCFGKSLIDFIRQKEGNFKSQIISIQEILSKNISIMRRTNSSLTSIPSDFKLLLVFHKDIENSRNLLENLRTQVEKAKIKVNYSLQNLENSRKYFSNIEIISKNQLIYDKDYSDHQLILELFNKEKEELKKNEENYSNTLIQTIITIFETYSVAHYRELIEINENINDLEIQINNLELPTDNSIQELETRLQLLNME